MDTNNIIGENIKRIRKIRALEQQEVAKAVGVNKSNICRYEKGETIPSLTVAINIARVLRCSMDELCGIKSRNRSN